MRETISDWNDLKLFLVVARHKGLAGAARETGTSAATLGRRMQALEQATGIEIFRRHARGYDLTDQGDALFAKISALDAEVSPLFTRKDGREKTLVKVSGGHWTLQALLQHIEPIMRAAPDARLRFISAHEILNINHREASIAIRNQRPHQVGLACRKIGTVSFAGYATSRDITGWIRVTSDTPSARWLADQSKAEIVMEANTSQFAKDLALKGVGRVVLPCFIGDHIEAFTKVHPDIAELDHEQWLVTHDEDRFIPAVRKVIDATHQALSAVIKSPPQA